MKVNQVINIDKTKEKDYNKTNLTNEATFTYYDYLKYKLFKKMQKAKNTTLHEQKERLFIPKSKCNSFIYRKTKMECSPNI